MPLRAGDSEMPRPRVDARRIHVLPGNARSNSAAWSTGAKSGDRVEERVDLLAILRGETPSR